MLTMQNVYDFINSLAPYDTQMSFDNSGMLVGDPHAEIHGILVAMDLTPPVIKEALSVGADLIVTHHPIMFSPVKQVLATSYEGRLVLALARHGLNMLCAHTNLDSAPGGINDVLAQRLGLTNITGEGYLRAGDLPTPMNAQELAAHVSHALNTVVRPMGQADSITRVAVCSGAGGDEWPGALTLGAQAFVTGEMKHHFALEAVDAGLLCLEAGHHATEEPGIFALADALQTELNRVQCSVHVTKSRAGAYAALPGSPDGGSLSRQKEEPYGSAAVGAYVAIPAGGHEGGSSRQRDQALSHSPEAGKEPRLHHRAAEAVQADRGAGGHPCRPQGRYPRCHRPVRGANRHHRRPV